MYIRRIAVRNFRKLVTPVVIEELGDGVTVIAGDNEEGKSTLLEAIRAGLFERHTVTGRAVEVMQPFGSAVRPEIQLAFEIDGENYTITKGFAQKPSARLTTPNGMFEGPAAEERLAELLTFRVPQRRESKPDDRGCWVCSGWSRVVGWRGLGLARQDARPYARRWRKRLATFSAVLAGAGCWRQQGQNAMPCLLRRASPEASLPLRLTRL
ncbi:MAG: AAA family ATPase [Gammaproteobacteria bacterium]